jgi:hypothetical protein
MCCLKRKTVGQFLSCKHYKEIIYMTKQDSSRNVSVVEHPKVSKENPLIRSRETVCKV